MNPSAMVSFKAVISSEPLVLLENKENETNRTVPEYLGYYGENSGQEGLVLILIMHFIKVRGRLSA